MSFLSNIAKLNPMSIASTIAESTLDTILPKNLEFVGDLASLAINIKSGNYAKAIDDLQDLQADLSQQLSSLAKQYGGQAGAAVCAAADLPAKAAAEPSPPPPYCDHAASGWKSAPENRAIAGSVTRGTPPGQAAETRAARANPPTAEASTPKSAPKASDTSSTATTAKADAPAETAAAKSETAADPAASKAKADAFFAKSDKELMDALRSGSLPKEVSSDPAQMQRLQMRINDYSQMNQLITTMLSALHEMNKQVIQNLRV